MQPIKRYLPKSSLSSCSETNWPRLATNRVEQGALAPPPMAEGVEAPAPAPGAATGEPPDAAAAAAAMWWWWWWWCGVEPISCAKWPLWLICIDPYSTENRKTNKVSTTRPKPNDKDELKKKTQFLSWQVCSRSRQVSSARAGMTSWPTHFDGCRSNHSNNSLGERDNFRQLAKDTFFFLQRSSCSLCSWEGLSSCSSCIRQRISIITSTLQFSCVQWRKERWKPNKSLRSWAENGKPQNR